MALGTVAVALLVARSRAHTTEVNLCGLEEGHHEGLLAAGSAAAHQPCAAQAHTLACRGRQ